MFFCKFLKLDKFKGADFYYDKSLFKILPQKQPKKDIFVLSFKILQLEKFKGTDFKYENIVFKFQPKTTQMKHFWF